jgi:azurin
MTASLLAGSSFLQAQGTATPAVAPAKPAAAAGAARTIEIAATDQMKFSLTALTAKPGEKLRVVLKGTGTMPKMAMGHNFVLLKLGFSAEKFAMESQSAGATEYIPASLKGQILAQTKLIGGGETTETTFTVPAKAGTYPFLCSFAGHFGAGMKGTLVVK